MLRVVADERARAVLRGDLDELAREGARRMLAAALEAEVDDYLAAQRPNATRLVGGWWSATATRASARSRLRPARSRCRRRGWMIAAAIRRPAGGPASAR
jgi:hypothetical protein